MKVGKPNSKRVPVRLRHKIEKASAAKQRKARKEAKKNPQWRSKIKKDPGIPNMFPYKNRILQEIEEKRRLKEEESSRRRNLAKGQKDSGQVYANGEDVSGDALDEGDLEDFESENEESMDVDESNPMAALLASATARAARFERRKESDEDAMDEDEEEEFAGFDDEDEEGVSSVAIRRDSSRRAFDKVYKHVVDSADVVLYVLDARDPQGTRSKEVEQMVMAADGGSKRLIFVLNKIDLVPQTVLKSWLVFLRRSFPTLPLRASKPAPNANVFDHKDLSIKGTSETLFKALKTFAESRQLKRSIKVGIIGYPNVGKSSVINALTSRLGGRSTTCPVGAEAGVTTSLREVKLDNKLKLLDSPGIVFPNTTEGSKNKIEEQARLILLNAIPPKEIDDPVPAVSLLLRRLSSSPDLFAKMVDFYNLPPLHTIDGDTTTDFLVQVARKRGRLGKGGIPNLHSAAQAVITDWRDGRIQGWTDPPKLLSAAAPPAAPPVSSSTGLVGDQKEIVKEWAAEFKLEGLWGGDAIDGGDAMET
ncbi:nucleolar GTP-binding protein-like protein 2 [Lojkania enalia]|uniref:Nucleolar GTP-binding protein-like protein 2 n=1 Tax=Lojkania enalia TaxID=147567 RepID=A0A9P4KCT1_9PLEO|nr:nucleolar GTP-binding protein-like protein 2 [Didymosphaeria enalia]